MRPFREKAGLKAFCLLLSAYTLIAFHIPFFSHLISHTEPGGNAVFITVSAALLLLILNYFLYYFLLYAGRTVGKCLVAFLLVGNAVMLYFVRNFDVLVTDDMMGNVLHTRYSEASGFFSFPLAVYVLLLGVLPSVYVFARKLDYGSLKGFFSGAGVSLALLTALVFGNMKNWPWVDANATELGSLLMPWSYTVNTFRHISKERQQGQKELPLPDARIVREGKDVCVLVIGESARRDHFSLYGYGRETNPYTAADSVTALVATSAATYTAAAVKAILEHKDSPQLYEILPNYLSRSGVEVLWRTSNWGEPPVHGARYLRAGDLKALYPEADERYDGILLQGLKEEILGADKDKVLVILHTNTNHGPAYYTKYPPEFQVFTPVCTTVEMSKAQKEELINAYDNSIVYTDWLIHSVIEMLRSLPERRSALIYVSDHGESLGENGLYMHGVPMAMAPKEQTEIPFLVWTSARNIGIKSDAPVGQHHVFHSVLAFLGVDSPVFDAEKCIFAQNF